MSGGWGVGHLYRGNGLTAFETGIWNRPADGIALDVTIPNLSVPPFHRHKQYAVILTRVEKARWRGEILDLPDASFVLLRDAAARDAIRAVFSPAVLSLLSSNPDFELAGNGDQLWLSASDRWYGDDVETILVEGARLLMDEVIPIAPSPLRLAVYERARDPLFGVAWERSRKAPIDDCRSREAIACRPKRRARRLCGSTLCRGFTPEGRRDFGRPIP